MNYLTDEQVVQLAPDASSLKAGRDLSQERKWLNFQSNERVLWGELQGSGKNPYQTQVDLNNTAFKCSCPSRKFPCKHGLGLLFLVAQKEGQIPSTIEEPLWVSDWMNKRSAKTHKVEEPTEAISPETIAAQAEKQAQAKAKRQEERYLKVQNGIAELELWLKDLVQAGLLTIPQKGIPYFERMAARLVDSQATGLAGLVKSFNKLDFVKNDDWQKKALEIISKIYLLIESFNRLDQLPPLVQEEVKARIGWNIQTKDLLDREDIDTIKDHWLVLGRQTTIEEGLTMQKNWLWGLKSQKKALVLNFSFGGMAIETPILPGTIAHANLAFYPSHTPLRATVKDYISTVDYLPEAISGSNSWDDVHTKAVDILAQNPWIDTVPMLIEQVRVVFHQGKYYLQDANETIVMIDAAVNQEQIWKLLAITGGNAVSLMVLYQFDSVIPLGIVQNYDYLLLD
ncbi:SWIM zinc finger family protein [Flectobacillus roseus]|uniref:SWIM zinc finger family protein n=1 Tax=Flectobacillus roseus TaxID=502259 RepID=A0ABT6Y670_9BACT|nr:SWIM zinc finger family protein [Flectobacillus roseus]MDI9859060.1 SWIM zinc finger family protein [Flectobacillus roseus]